MTNRLAIYDLNRYLWNVGLSGHHALFAQVPLPIFPVQQVPEGMTGAHIVYTSRTIPGLDLWQTSIDEVLYRVYAEDLDQATALAGEITRAFRKIDESAAHINTYLASVGSTDFHFLYTRVLGNNSPNPINSEDGFHGRPVWVRVHYIENEY